MIKESFARAYGRAILGLVLVFCLLEGPTEIDATSATGKKSSKPRKPQTVLWKADEITIVEETILELTNSARKDKGLNPLVRSSALDFLGRGQSKNMCSVGRMIHESEDFPEGWRRFMQRMSMVRARSGAENIAFHTMVEDPRKWASAVVKGWLKSPPHTKNLLDPRWRYMGIGLEPCGEKKVYAAQEFSAEPGIVPKDTSSASGP